MTKQKHRAALIALLLLNLLFAYLAWRTPVVPLTGWRKGPVMHARSLYGPIRAPRIFWAFSMVFLDTYVGLAVVMRRRNRARGWPRLGQSVLAAALAFGVTEGAVRLTVRHLHPGRHFHPHPDLFYWNARGLRSSREMPDALPESTTSRGFRGTNEVPVVKADDEYRVCVVGDSSAFGHGVLDHETFAHQLESLLAAGMERPVRVINAACPGHCTYEGLIIFREMLLPLEPDLLIVSYNNDPSPEYVEEKHRAPATPWAWALRRGLYRSEYYLFLQRTVQNIMLHGRYAHDKKEPPLVPRVSLDDYRANLKTFVDQGRANNCDVLFVRMPVNHPLLRDFKERQKYINPLYPATLLDWCRDEAVPVVDVDRVFGRETLSHVFLEGDHFHPNATGHRRLAELLADRILTPVEPPPKRPRIHIGYSTLTPLHGVLGQVLTHTDILERHGLEGSFLGFLRGRDQDAACRAGMVDITFSCEVPAIIHRQHHPFLQIAGSPGALGEIALVTRPESPVTQVADLRGKRIVIRGGASATLLGDRWLTQAGLDPLHDVQCELAQGPWDAPLWMLEQGHADAAILWDPWLTEAEAQGALRRLAHAPFWSVLFVDERLKQRLPDAETRTLAVLQDAMQWAIEHPDQAVAWASRRSGTPAAVIRAVLQKNRFFAGEAVNDWALLDEQKERLKACEKYVERSEGDVQRPTSKEFPLPRGEGQGEGL